MVMVNDGVLVKLKRKQKCTSVYTKDQGRWGNISYLTYIISVSVEMQILMALNLHRNIHFCTIYNGEIKLHWLVVRRIWLQMRLVRNCALVLNMKTDTMTTKAVILRDTMQSCHIDSIRKTDRLNLC